MQHDTFSNIVPSFIQPGKICGLANVHRESSPLCPVASTIRTAECSLTNHLLKIINYATTYVLSSTGSFVKQIGLFNF